MSYMEKPLTIRLPLKMRRELEKLSREKHYPLSDLVRESLQRYLAAERFQVLRKKIVPFAEAQGYLTDEDIFKALS